MNLYRTALTSALTAAITFAPMQLIPADAVVTAIANNSSNALATLSVSSASFILYPTANVAGANPGAALTLAKTNASQYFYLRNTGSVEISRFSLSITGTSSAAFTLSRCDEKVEFTSVDVCSSGSPTVITVLVGEITLTVPTSSWFNFQLTPSKQSTPSISVSVSSSQIRGGFVTNS